MENIKALIELLGEASVEHLKKRITELLIARVESDLDDWRDYLFDPDDYTDFMNEIVKECRKEVKAIVKKKLTEAALK